MISNLKLAVVVFLKSKNFLWIFVNNAYPVHLYKERYYKLTQLIICFSSRTGDLKGGYGNASHPEGDFYNTVPYGELLPLPPQATPSTQRGFYNEEFSPLRLDTCKDDCKYSFLYIFWHMKHSLIILILYFSTILQIKEIFLIVVYLYCGFDQGIHCLWFYIQFLLRTLILMQCKIYNLSV